MEKMKKKLTLDIANSRITIITDEDEEYVKKLAEFISQKINALSLSGGGITKTDAALLYALELLDENFKLKMDIAEMKRGRNGN
jgi:cell division protein ZapA (FtsZ GTPase activity inhibitor)